MNIEPTTNPAITVTPAATPTPPPPKKPGTAAAAYTLWQNDPTPDRLHGVIKALEPTISYKMSAMGVADNPQMKHQARLFAAEAVRRYDPAAGVGLTTWTQSQLQSMHRFRRENQGPVKIPDRAALDAWTLEKATRQFADEHGRDPDVRELADASNLSVKRIASVRKATRPIASASQMHTDPAHNVDFMGEALEYLYDDLDYVDRSIVEMSTGYGGASVLAKNRIAEKLGISPSQVTRRTDRISQRLQEMEQRLEDTHA